MIDEVADEQRASPAGAGDHYQLKAGDIDPELNKTIGEIVLSTNHFIVYVDSEQAVQWRTTDHHKMPEYCGEVLNMVAALEAKSQFISNPLALRVVRRRIGEGLARCLDGHPKENSIAALREVELELEIRNKEIAWKWYFLSAMKLTAVLVAIFAVLWLLRNQARALVGSAAFEVILGSICGALGALLSVISRSNRLIMDANAGKALHQLEGLSRIGAGLIGALLVALSIKAGIILGGTRFSGNSMALLLAFCIVSGTSERLVPSLISIIEKNATSKRSHDKYKNGARIKS